ncbi:MAG: hypothetical protein AB7O48_16125 [Cyclobacteriaceae bacterium]
MDEREKFYIEQKVRLNTELLKILSIIDVATITGIISLIIAEDLIKPVNTILLVFGAIIIVVLTNLVILVYRDNVTLLNNARIGN